MRWFVKVAKHGNTLDGQMMTQELNKLTKDVRKLVTEAIAGGPSSVLPRWRGEIRRSILLLPSEERLNKLSMYEIEELKTKVAEIKAKIERYDTKRLMEIMGAK
jgi:uncharacterized small protein (DUF1192 family)